MGNNIVHTFGDIVKIVSFMFTFWNLPNNRYPCVIYETLRDIGTFPPDLLSWLIPLKNEMKKRKLFRALVYLYPSGDDDEAAKSTHTTLLARNASSQPAGYLTNNVSAQHN